MREKDRNIVLVALLVVWIILFSICYMSGIAAHEIGHVF